jgi:hypothetical protein
LDNSFLGAISRQAFKKNGMSLYPLGITGNFIKKQVKFLHHVMVSGASFFRFVPHPQVYLQGPYSSEALPLGPY